MYGTRIVCAVTQHESMWVTMMTQHESICEGSLISIVLRLLKKTMQSCITFSALFCPAWGHAGGHTVFLYHVCECRCKSHSAGCWYCTSAAVPGTESLLLWWSWGCWRSSWRQSWGTTACAYLLTLFCRYHLWLEIVHESFNISFYVCAVCVSVSHYVCPSCLWAWALLKVWLVCKPFVFHDTHSQTLSVRRALKLGSACESCTNKAWGLT